MAAGNGIADRIKGFIVEAFPLARTRGVGHGDDLLAAGIVDSLGVLDVVAFVEREFSVTVNDEDLSPENFRSIERLAALVQGRLAR
jgi:acyl carrier protein